MGFPPMSPSLVLFFSLLFPLDFSPWGGIDLKTLGREPPSFGRLVWLAAVAG